MSDQPVKPKVYIGDQHHKRLWDLAQADKRGYGAEVEWLIDQELERRDDQQNPSKDEGVDRE